MNLVRFVRIWAPLVILGLAGSLLGCSGRPAPTPVDKATEKQIFVETRKARQEIKEDQSKPKVRPDMREGHRREQ
jgi:hypothetical protein